LPEILVARVEWTDSGGFGPEWTSDVSDVLARRVSSRGGPQDEHDSAAGRPLSLGQRGQHRSTGHWEIGDEVGLRQAHDLAVVSGVGDEQDHCLGSVVAPLEGLSARKCLDIT